MNSCIYEGWVHHRRLTPIEHAFRKRLFFLYLDLDELDEVFAGRWMWSHKSYALASFRRSDHFGCAETPLVEAVRELTAVRGPIRLLTHLRYFGYVFNPLSLYFCHSTDGDLSEIVAEVQNTPWKERHCYTLSRSQFAPNNDQVMAKEFHVSPFMPMDMSYRWAITDPAETLAISLQSRREREMAFAVNMQLQRREITTASLLRMLIQYPFMTQQVTASIYWQAFHLWRKGVPFYPHPRKTTGKGSDDFDRIQPTDVLHQSKSSRSDQRKVTVPTNR